MDMEDIPPGVKFADYIGEAVASCDALIALIGPAWLQAADSEGKRRLDDPADFTRLEITSALERDVRVIPTLVGGALMPSPKTLPDALKGLCDRQNYEIADRAWEDSCNRLANALKLVVKPSAFAAAVPPDANGPGQRGRWAAGAATLALSVTGLLVWAPWHVNPAKAPGLAAVAASASTANAAITVATGSQQAPAAGDKPLSPPATLAAMPAPASSVPGRPAPASTAPAGTAPASTAPASTASAWPGAAVPPAPSRASSRPSAPPRPAAAMRAAAPASAPVRATAAAVPDIGDPAAAETALWDRIKSSRNASDFEAYLQRYPGGQYAALAKSRSGSWITDANGCKLESGDAKPNTRITWSGDCVNGKADGPGVYEEFVSGKKAVTLTGRLRAGKTDGVVTVSSANGSVYKGQLVQGKPAGPGQLQLPGDVHIDGMFVAGKLHGRGIVSKPNGWRYEGDFQRGDMTDRGVQSDRDGRYVGDFVRGKFDGIGVLSDTKGLRYEGGFKAGKFDGRGNLLLANGVRVIGNFAAGHPDGRMTIVATNGQRGEKTFANGKEVATR